MNAARIRPDHIHIITVDLSKVPQLTPPLSSAKFRVTSDTTGDDVMKQIFTRTGILPQNQQLTITEKSNLGNRATVEMQDIVVDPAMKISSYFMTLSIVSPDGKDPVYPVLELAKKA